MNNALKFKVGDKVNIVGSEFLSRFDKIFTVIMADSTNQIFPYRVESNDKSWNCLMYERELQPLIRKGQLYLWEIIAYE